MILPVSVRSGYLALVVVAVAGALLVLLGGSAQSQTPVASIVAKDPYMFETAAGGAPNVTIAAGGTVSFSQGGSNPHNVVFKDAQPTCVQTAGANSGAVPPLPNQATSTAWAGACTSPAAGTYAFYCGFPGPNMNGSVTVPGAGTPPPPPP